MLQGLSLRGLSYFSQLAVPVSLASSGVYGLRLWSLVFVTWALSAAGVLLPSLLYRRPFRWLSAAGIAAAAVSFLAKGLLLVAAFYVIAFVSSYFSYFAVTEAYEGGNVRGVFGIMAGNAAGLIVGSGAAAVMIYLRPAMSALLLALSAVVILTMKDMKEIPREPKKSGLALTIKDVLSMNSLFALAAVASLDWAIYTSYSAPAFSRLGSNGPLLATLSALLINAITFGVRLYMSGRSVRVSGVMLQLAALPYAFGLAALYAFIRAPYIPVLLIAAALIAVSHSLFPPLNLFEFLRRSSDRGIGYLSYSASVGAGEVASNLFSAFFVLGGSYGQLFAASAALTVIASAAYSIGYARRR